MTKFLLSVIGFIIMLGASILVMIHGWGIEPVSWGWIIGGGTAGVFIGALFNMSENK